MSPSTLRKRVSQGGAAVLVVDLPQQGLRRGQVGVVRAVDPDGQTVIVQFRKGRKRILVRLRSEQVQMKMKRSIRLANSPQALALDRWQVVGDSGAAVPPRPLLEIMEDISRKAQSRGLTPEILASLLAEI